MYAVCELNVRTHLRYVSAIGQSQAVSMCACPIAATSWLWSPFRWAYSGVSSARASAQVSRSSGRQTLQKRFSWSSSCPASDGSRPRACSASSCRSTSKSKHRSHACSSNNAMSQRSRTTGSIEE